MAMALQRWLVVVAMLRMLSVVIGYFYPEKFKTSLFTRQPHLVNELTARVFAVWTLVTCMLCLICAAHPTSKPIYGATLGSFVVALGFFISEVFIYKTVSLKGAISPGIVASVSTIWMAAGWNYYTKYALEEAGGVKLE